MSVSNKHTICAYALLYWTHGSSLIDQDYSLFLQRTIAFSSQLKQQFMWLAQSVRELNGARLEASVRAYGGAGQRKVSNKWLGCYLRPRVCDSPRRVSYMAKQSSGMLLLWKVGSWTI
uniref:Uncharacterized protein n=1 Tax=Triticum urartu TaxID=4572 RepID=A0A8R7TLM5_TRIUA